MQKKCWRWRLFTDTRDLLFTTERRYMRVIEITYPLYKLEHRNGFRFSVHARREADGRLSYEPTRGWGVLAHETRQDTESLLEDIDDAIYNTFGTCST